jgi:hypothetical protein
VTDTLPDNTGYVAAAYLVFFALVLIYVVIMAAKLQRFERELAELNELADRRLDEAHDHDAEAVRTQQRVVARSAIAGNLDTESSQ